MLQTDYPSQVRRHEENVPICGYRGDSQNKSETIEKNMKVTVVPVITGVLRTILKSLSKKLETQ